MNGAPEPVPGRTRRLLSAALSAAGRGWPVFPVQPYGKRPAITGWPQAATCDPDVLAAWWERAPYNVGVACGPARLLVVDLDGPGEPPAEWAGARAGAAVFAELARRVPAELVPTFTVATPSDGEHRYFTVTEGQVSRSTAGTLGWHIDTRGTGGYVLAAGSILRVDQRPRYYRVIDPAPPAPLPDWIAGLLAPSAIEGSVTSLPREVGRRSAYGQAALDGEADRVRAARPGTRNALLFDAAVRLGTLVAAAVLNDGEVRQMLLAACAVHFGVDGFTAAEADRAIGNGLRYGLQRPRQVGNR